MPKKRRRQRGEGGLYQRADGMWVGSVDLGWTDDGKRRRKVVYAATQNAALKKLNDVKGVVAAHGDIPTAGITAAQWLTYWLDHIAPTKPSTHRSYAGAVNRHIIPAIGRHRLDRLGPEHVRHMHRQILAKTFRGKPVTTNTAHHAHRILSLALEAARREGRVVRNVAELVDPPNRQTSDRTALTAAQARRLLRSTADDRLSSRWMMALLTGARQGECLGLRWRHVDLTERQLDLAWQQQRLGYRHGCGPGVGRTWPCGKKRAGSCPARELDVPRDYQHIRLAGGICLVRPKAAASTRMLPMPPSLHASLTARRKVYEDERQAYAVDHDLVWCQLDGRPIEQPDDTVAWHDALAAAGLPPVDLHAARHTTATLLLEAGVDVKVIGQIVGHSTAATTRGYQHVSLELARRALDELVDRIQL